MYIALCVCVCVCRELPDMAEGRDGGSHLSPLEEQYIREAEEEVGDVDAQLQREKEVAAQKLWCAFQDSATAVAHLFR